MENNPSLDVSAPHSFQIHFNFRNQLQTASLTMSQKADHDEYFIIADNEGLAREFGGQVLDFYFDQPNPLRSVYLENDYTRSLIKGVNEFLSSKHS